ncbi:MAG: P63C domain-containing protein [Syntrophobacteraceae bacterium]
MAAGSLKPFISQELLESTRPIRFRNSKGIKAFGYSAELLPKVCQVYLEARDAGALQANQLSIAVKCEILVRGLAQTGIIALVDEATGYQKVRDRDELQRFLALYLSEERLKWAKMFPDEYYRQLFRLQGWQYSPLSVKRPKLVGVLTNRLVYEKLPDHVLDELRRLNPVKNKKTWRREATFFQHLSADIGQEDLRAHLLQLIAVMRASANWANFKRNFARAFPGPEGIQLEMDETIDV